MVFQNFLSNDGIGNEKLNGLSISWLTYLLEISEKKLKFIEIDKKKKNI